MTDEIKAVVATETEHGVRGALTSIDVGDLPDEDVLVEIAYSSLNYKDGLAVSGMGKICRSLPMVCGIDLAGTVLESRSAEFKAGDEVVGTGWGLGEKYWGGYAQRQRLKPKWLVRIPAGLTAELCMAIGTAGYTAMLCAQAIRDHGVEPGVGPIVVSGATGGVGSFAVMILTKLGFDVHAVTGKPDAADYLAELGARATMARDELQRDCRPLESERWAAGVDAVGGKTLATMLAQTRYGGIVTACGLAGGTDLPTSVMPFILRAVTLAGIDSVMGDKGRRERAWSTLAELADKKKLASIYRVEPMSRLPQLAEDIVAGRITGRVVIDVNE